jgi:hypothetical protein
MYVVETVVQLMVASFCSRTGLERILSGVMWLMGRFEVETWRLAPGTHWEKNSRRRRQDPETRACPDHNPFSLVSVHFSMTIEYHRAED